MLTLSGASGSESWSLRLRYALKASERGTFYYGDNPPLLRSTMVMASELFHSSSLRPLGSASSVSDLMTLKPKAS